MSAFVELPLLLTPEQASLIVDNIILFLGSFSLQNWLPWNLQKVGQKAFVILD